MTESFSIRLAEELILLMLDEWVSGDGSRLGLRLRDGGRGDRGISLSKAASIPIWRRCTWSTERQRETRCSTRRSRRSAMRRRRRRRSTGSKGTPPGPKRLSRSRSIAWSRTVSAVVKESAFKPKTRTILPTRPIPKLSVAQPPGGGESRPADAALDRRGNGAPAHAADSGRPLRCGSAAHFRAREGRCGCCFSRPCCSRGVGKGFWECCSSPSPLFSCSSE